MASPQRIKVNGVELSYTDEGRGEPLLFVHGALGDYRSWERISPAYTPRFRVISYSLRGHFPGTQADDAFATAQEHAGDLVALLEALRLGRAHVVGQSFGGAVALVAAWQQPELVNRLVLAEPSLFSLLSGMPEGPALIGEFLAGADGVLARLDAGEQRRAVEEFIDLVIAPGFFAKLPADVQARMLDNAHTLAPVLRARRHVAPFRPEHAQQVRTPTLLLGGEWSRPIFLQTLAQLQWYLADVRTEILPRTTHALSLENPDAFNAAVRSFLDG